MGRQLILAATPPDEVNLLRFIRSIAPIRVFVPFARSAGELWITDWETNGIQASAFAVWPQTFSWSPTYAQSGALNCPPEGAGRFYVANANVAPVLEVTRTYFDRRQFGRIYWARNFSASCPLGYDVAEFARLTDAVWRWIRKVGRRTPSATAYSPYFLPDAWAKHANLAA